MSLVVTKYTSFAVVVAAAVGSLATAAPITLTASGANPAGIQLMVDNFRTSLGTLNGGGPGPFASGRREVNWDAAPDAVSDPNPFPGDFFNAGFSPRARGIEFSSSGGFLLSSTAASGQPVEFGFDADLQTFSAERLFSPVGSNITNVNFFVPNNPTEAAGVSGLGVVFTNVLPGSGASIELFDSNNASLAFVNVPTSTAGSLSFVGIRFDAGELAASATITTGTSSLTSNGSRTPGIFVAMDDFIYGEPQSLGAAPAAVPTPAAALLMLAGLLIMRRRS